MNVMLNTAHQSNAGFIANASSSINVFSLARRVADFNVPVLITGETGTGKECVAKFIHHHALGDHSPYIGVNCAAIPETMLEAVLFGYEKGAFTGAVTSTPGKFEQANGGTLLLDEIGDMPLALQAKILRVLQEQEVERLGSNKRIPLDIRLMASTNKNLDIEIAEGRFRQDLLYRLSVVPIHIPPLRERYEDIIPLAKNFINKYQSISKMNIHITDEALMALQEYHWPGNVRELENVIQRGIIMSNNGHILSADLGLNHIDNLCLKPPVAMQLSQENSHVKPNIKSRGRLAEYKYIVDLLEQYKGNKSKTAAFLGITPRALRYRLASMRQNGIDIECYS